HGIKNYDIDIYANNESQAKTSFDDVFKVIKDHPDLDKKVFKATKEVIQNIATNSKLRYNTANARTKDGKRPGANRFDEIHENEDYSMINVATSGGGKIRDYREFYDTTNGHVRGGPLDDIIEESKMILSGELGIDKDGAEFSSLFPFICRLDNDNEVDDP
ncbi:TPA: terminase large subunit, partial [Enterococcus faecium]|nr:terminase large subunit [Enterococcus faecium]